MNSKLLYAIYFESFSPKNMAFVEVLRLVKKEIMLVTILLFTIDPHSQLFSTENLMIFPEKKKSQLKQYMHILNVNIIRLSMVQRRTDLVYYTQVHKFKNSRNCAISEIKF